MKRGCLFIIMLNCLAFTVNAQTINDSSKKKDSTIPYSVYYRVFYSINFDPIIGKEYTLDCSKCSMIYWQDSLISFRTFWDINKSKPKHEFCRIEPGRLLYRHYDSSKPYAISEGEFRLTLGSIHTDTSYVTSSKGNTEAIEVRYTKFLELEKNGDWFEALDSIHTYAGEYVNGIKNGRWTETKNYDSYTGKERYLYYNMGVLVRVDTINAVLNNTITDKMLFKSWDLDIYNYNSRVLPYYPKTTQFSRNETTFTEDHKYITKIHISCAIPQGGRVKEGTWRIEKNKLIFKNDEHEDAFEILSLSDSELIIKY